MNDEPKMKNATEKFEKANEGGSKDQTYVLRLFVSGMTAGSLKAIKNIKKICDEHFEGRYELEVIDLYQHPEMGKREQIIATPTLIKKLPLPFRKFIGDLSNTEKILVGLDIFHRK